MLLIQAGRFLQANMEKSKFELSAMLIDGGKKKRIDFIFLNHHRRKVQVFFLKDLKRRPHTNTRKAQFF